MQQRETCWSCTKGHSFDLARSGYVNLLPVNRKHAKNPGDNAVMMRARKRFLDAGYYGTLQEALKRVVVSYARAGGILLDAGCGEGYYTAGMGEALTEAQIPMQIYGVDISKSAADAAAKRYPQGKFAVGSVFHLPVADRCCDVLTTIFAPYCGEEYHRVLRKNGVMIMVIPGQQHLWGLKEAIYDVPYPNAVRDYALEGFELIQAEYVDSWMKLVRPEDIQNLFQMTPYYYKTGREEHARLEKLETLSTQISFEILQYRRVEYVYEN
jgi:23S rRNA (guanine745-N1)-methyltransferase